MSSKISTLLEDIASRLEERKEPEQANLTLFLEEIKEVMQNFFTEDSSHDSTGKLRLSSVGREDRKLWYGFQGYEKENPLRRMRIMYPFLQYRVNGKRGTFVTTSPGHRWFSPVFLL